MFKAVGHYCCSARYTAQSWSPPAGHHPTGSASCLHLDCSPLHLALDQACLLSPHPPLSFLVSPSEAAWRLLLLANSEAHTTARHSPSITAVKGFFSAHQVFPPKWSLQNTCPSEIQSFLLPVTKPGENEVLTPPHFQIANI